MSRRLLLDGNDLGVLIQRARTELGPDAVIVKAERVRSGGVAGFFASEHFEVAVEVPDDARPPTGGMSALLDAADAADGNAAPTGAGQRAATPGAAPGAAPAGIADARSRSAVPAAAQVSTDSDTFAALLASIDGMARAQPEPGATPVDVPAPWAPASEERAAIPPARFAPQGATVTPATFAPLEQSAPSDPPTTADDAGTVAGTGADSPARPMRAEASERAAAPKRPVPGPRGRGPKGPRGATPRAVVSPGAGSATSTVTGEGRQALLDLGVPASVLGTGRSDEPLSLSSVLAALPRPSVPLRSAGSVVVVVGEGSQALPVAAQFAERARLSGQDVVLAGAVEAVPGSNPRLLSRAAAARHRDDLTESDPVSIVALGVWPEAQDWAAAAELLAALDPDQTWAVVDARRKSSDLRTWMRALSGDRPFDAVAAAWVNETQEPGTVLDLGVPVGWLDGNPATPFAWAAVLTKGLDARAHED